jgi:rhodanese-related sulfurtransferase
MSKAELPSRPNPDFPDVRDLRCEDLHAYLQEHGSEKIALIDVRQPEEYVGELGHVPDAELWVLGTLPDRIDELPRDRDVVFICRSGGRSAQAAAYVQHFEFQRCFNLQGGMIRWNNLGYPTEKGPA